MLANSQSNTNNNLFYIQVHTTGNNSYWYRYTKSSDWIGTEDCIGDNALPTAVTIFKAKQIIAKDKKEDEGCTYFLILATSTPIQIIE